MDWFCVDITRWIVRIDLHIWLYGDWMQSDHAIKWITNDSIVVPNKILRIPMETKAKRKCHVHANENGNEMDLIYDWRWYGLVAVSLVMALYKKSTYLSKMRAWFAWSMMVDGIGWLFGGINANWYWSVDEEVKMAQLWGVCRGNSDRSWWWFDLLVAECDCVWFWGEEREWRMDDDWVRVSVCVWDCLCLCMWLRKQRAHSLVLKEDPMIRCVVSDGGQLCLGKWLYHDRIR